MVDFSQITNMNLDNVEKPKPFPEGHYMGLIVSHEFDTSSKKQTPFYRIMIQLQEPLEDVDQEAFEEAGGMEKLVKRQVRSEYYLTEDAMWRLKEFFEEVLKLETAGRSIADLAPEANQRVVIVEIGHRLGGQNNNETFMDVRSLLPEDGQAAAA